MHAWFIIILVILLVQWSHGLNNQTFLYKQALAFDIWMSMPISWWILNHHQPSSTAIGKDMDSKGMSDSAIVQKMLEQVQFSLACIDY